VASKAQGARGSFVKSNPLDVVKIFSLTGGPLLAGDEQIKTLDFGAIEKR